MNSRLDVTPRWGRVTPEQSKRLKVLAHPVYGPALVTIALRRNAAKHGRTFTVYLLPTVQP